MTAVRRTNTQWSDLAAWSLTADEGATDEAPHIDTATQQTLHYTLNQQVQFHRIGEDGQVQVVSDKLRHGCFMVTRLNQCTNFLFSGCSRNYSQKILAAPPIIFPKVCKTKINGCKMVEGFPLTWNCSYKTFLKFIISKTSNYSKKEFEQTKIPRKDFFDLIGWYTLLHAGNYRCILERHNGPHNEEVVREKGFISFVIWTSVCFCFT